MDHHSPDCARPETAVVAVVVKFEFAGGSDEEGEETAADHGVAVQLPAEPPLVDIVILGKQYMPHHIYMEVRFCTVVTKSAFHGLVTKTRSKNTCRHLASYFGKLRKLDLR